MKEALKLALEAFEAIPEEIEAWIPDKCTDAVIAIKEALAQPEQEPVAEIVSNVNGSLSTQWSEKWLPNPGDKLYTTPPQRIWVGLTEEELNLIYAKPQTHIGQYARAIEAKLKERNT